jgi:hypothetical protein
MKRPPESSPPALLPSRSIVAGTLIAATVAATGLFFARPAAVEINGRRIVTDVPPVTRAREAFVPVRAVAEGLGAAASFDPKTREVSIERGHRVLRMKLGEKNATLDGDPIVLSQAPFALRGRAMVASAAIERAFGPRIRYDSARAKIDVVSRELLEADATKDK